jgi:uncharacterized protein
LDKYEKLQNLKNILKDMGSVVVALSGGVDSAFLLKVASEVLGNRCIAATAIANIYPTWEQREAGEIADSLGVEYTKLECNPIVEVPGFAQNPVDRCYLCKKAIFSKLMEYSENIGVNYVVDGTNADDMGDYRPGLRAITELGVKSPLLMAELTKEEIRLLSKEYGLTTFDKPSFACLATRIPYQEEINTKKLKMIDNAEEYLISLGIRNVRVRCHGDMARIEVEKNDINKFMPEDFRENITNKLKSFGFKYVCLDLIGYKMGNMNLEVKNG